MALNLNPEDPAPDDAGLLLALEDAWLDLLEAGATLDWPGRLYARLMDIANQGGHTFVLPRHGTGGYAMMDIEWFLRSKGINTWGAMAVDRCWLLTVHPEQAAYASYWLQRLGCTVEYGLAE